VTPSSGPPTALIVDEDVGFIWWLGEIFNEVGYQAVPALSARQAVALFEETKFVVDLVVVNPGLPGVWDMLETLSRSRPPAVVLIENPEAVSIAGIRALATLERPSGWEPVSRAEWLRKVRRVVQQLDNRAAG
jgi:DNA-binding response OmpR family regulator